MFGDLQQQWEIKVAIMISFTKIKGMFFLKIKTVGFNKPQAIEAFNYNISFIKEGLSPTFAQMTETTASDLFYQVK